MLEGRKPSESTHEFAEDDTLSDAVAVTAAALGEAGIEEPRRTARSLVAAAAGIGAIRLIATPGARLGQEAAQRLEEFLRRRLASEPISRILGRREFYGRDFSLSPATLDPRPDTEVLIEAAKELIREEGWGERPLRLIDIGTGTGAIAITMLAEFPKATAVATDISAEALETTRANARHLGVEDRLELVETRSLEGVEGPFDLLLSNPPYIPSTDIGGLDAEVRLFDPLAALDGGPDGLQVYRELGAGLQRVVPRGWALFEVGADQASDVAQILSNQGLHDLRTWQDLGGHTRCVACRTRCG